MHATADLQTWANAIDENGIARLFSPSRVEQLNLSSLTRTQNDGALANVITASVVKASLALPMRSYLFLLRVHTFVCNRSQPFN